MCHIHMCEQQFSEVESSTLRFTSMGNVAQSFHKPQAEEAVTSPVLEFVQISKGGATGIASEKSNLPIHNIFHKGRRIRKSKE